MRISDWSSDVCSSDLFSKASVASTSPRSASQPRRLSILGSTGSIGCSTLDLVERNRDAFEVEVLTANRSVARLAMQAKRFGARLAVVADATAYADQIGRASWRERVCQCV